MHIAESIADLQSARASWGVDDVALVPTMGALHEGHLRLIAQARHSAKRVVVSIFVNPLQFGPKEDLSRYPRPKSADLAACQAAGVDLVFYPSVQDLYPHGQGSLTCVVPPETLTGQFCGASRPGHFTGVATVVLKLLNLVQPQQAFFGQKDAQQLAVIQHMVRDLNLSVEIVPVPTVREADGLAKSSRNQYLSGALRSQARLLSRLIGSIQELWQQGETDALTLCQEAQTSVLNESLYPDFRLDYLAIVDAETFQPVVSVTADSRILVAAFVGEVRLIDNAQLSDALCLKPNALLV